MGNQHQALLEAMVMYAIVYTITVVKINSFVMYFLLFIPLICVFTGATNDQYS